MKKIYVLLIVAALFPGCAKSNSDPGTTNGSCGFHNGNQLYLGPKGGCYYIGSGGNKEYVDRSECTCSLN